MTRLLNLPALAAISILALSACAKSNPPEAKPPADLTFVSALTGDRFPAKTGSTATGAARLTIHADDTVDLALSVNGITISELADPLVASAFGPVHLHLYSPDGQVSFLMVFPFGEAFSETEGGFDVVYNGIPYSENAAKFNPDPKISDLIEGLHTGYAYLNVHTDAFPDVEISGVMVETIDATT